MAFVDQTQRLPELSNHISFFTWKPSLLLHFPNEKEGILFQAGLPFGHFHEYRCKLKAKKLKLKTINPGLFFVRFGGPVGPTFSFFSSNLWGFCKNLKLFAYSFMAIQRYRRKQCHYVEKVLETSDRHRPATLYFWPLKRRPRSS